MADYQRRQMQHNRQQYRGQVQQADVDFSKFVPTLGPKTFTMMFIWCFALWALFFGNGIPVDPETEARYSTLMSQATFSDEAIAIQRDLQQAMNRRDREKVWFWRWKSPAKEIVARHQQKVDQIQAELDVVNGERTAQIRKAKKLVGVWSEFGVSEAKESFWNAYQAGKDFAKRMTFWDVLFMASDREEGLAGFLIRWVSRILMNFTIGMIGSLFFFATSLISMIWSYSPDPISGTLFFVMCMLGAVGMVMLFLSIMYGSAVGVGYVVVKQAQVAQLQNNARAREQMQFRRHNQGPQGGPQKFD